MARDVGFARGAKEKMRKGKEEKKKRKGRKKREAKKTAGENGNKQTIGMKRSRTNRQNQGLKTRNIQRSLAGAPVSRGQAPLGDKVSPYLPYSLNLKSRRVGIIRVPVKMRVNGVGSKDLM